MIGVSRTLVLFLLPIFMICGCAGTPRLASQRGPDVTTKVGLLEQVEAQQERIEVLEWEVEELWLRSEQSRIEVLEWELDQLRRMGQEERVEALEHKLAELGR